MYKHLKAYNLFEYKWLVFKNMYHDIKYITAVES